MLTYGWFITTAHPILKIRFKNILRTFKAQNPQNIQKHSASARKIRLSYKKKIVSHLNNAEPLVITV